MQNILIYIALLGIMLQAGCGTMFQNESGTPPFGSSVRMAVAGQTVNPEAGGDTPVVGLDGRYADAVMERYQAGPDASEGSDEGTISGK
jgi:uncharacterized protein YceK